MGTEAYAVLQTFVMESLGLSGEEINTASNDFENHLAAAKLVWDEASSRHVKPLDIYRVMCPREAEFPYRGFEAYLDTQGEQVTSLTFPPPVAIPHMMEEHTQLAERLCLQGVLLPEESRGCWAENIMLQGLAILPFADNNRRVYRLYLNALRLRLELPWLPIQRSERQFYDDLILGFRMTMLARE